MGIAKRRAERHHAAVLVRARLLIAATVATICVGLYLGACSLDESGLAGADADSDGIALPDVSADACGPCGALLAAGWQLVALQANGTSCPAGAALEAVQEGLDAGPGLCDCACSEVPGACSSGTVTLGYQASCSSSAQVNVDGGCEMNTGVLAAGAFSAQFTPRNNNGCTPSVVVNDAAIASTTDVLCHPTATCDESLCSGNPAPGYSACIVQTGDVQCPPGPFQARHVVGQPNVSCGPCTCACAGTFAFYFDSQCGAAAMVIDSGCTPTSNPGAAVASDRWNSSGCVAQGPRDGSVALANARTVCCR